MKNVIQPVKGTREFYPRAWPCATLFMKRCRAASQSFGYQEWDGPSSKSIDLYAAKSGEELVKKQSFVFEDRAAIW